MKKLSQAFKASALALGLLSTAAAGTVHAARLADGRVVFDQSPKLVEATTFDYAAGFSGRYHFVIEVPADAGEPLEAIAIMPLEAAQHIDFKLASTTAQRGGVYANGPNLPLASVGGAPEDPAHVLVVFEQPVQPGETATVTLATARNPWGGVYVFRVVGYPAGDNGVGQTLGYGRIQTYNNQ
ncbi:MAG: DUF2808 domain-containing protein, partial [Nodosilinea sp.]